MRKGGREGQRAIPGAHSQRDHPAGPLLTVASDTPFLRSNRSPRIDTQTQACTVRLSRSSPPPALQKYTINLYFGGMDATRLFTEVNISIHELSLSLSLTHTHTHTHTCLSIYLSIYLSTCIYIIGRYIYKWAVTCLSLAGFQSGSKSTSRDAPTRLRPHPPALLLSRNANWCFIGSLNSSTSFWRFPVPVEPSRRTKGMPLKRHRSSKMSSVCV